MSRPVSPSIQAELSRMEIFGICGVFSRNKSRIGNKGDYLHCFNEHKETMILANCHNGNNACTSAAFTLLQNIYFNLPILIFIDGLLSGLLSLVSFLKKKHCLSAMEW